jgi:membrane protein
VWHRSQENRLTTVASSIAFYLLLGSIPGLAAVVSLYGTFGDANDVVRVSRTLVGILPPEISQMLLRQIARLADQDGATGKSLLASIGWIAFIVWSANRGMRGLVDGLNVIYGSTEERNWLIRLAMTMAMTIGVVGFLALSIFAVILVPVILDRLEIDEGLGEALTLLRWPATLVMVGAASALLLRFGPSRRFVRWRSLILASALSAVLWMGQSIVFSWYVRNFAGFSEIYGSLGSVAAFMTWLWLSALAVLIGAEIDAARIFLQSEHDFAGQETQDQENHDDGQANEE